MNNPGVLRAPHSHAAEVDGSELPPGQVRWLPKTYLPWRGCHYHSGDCGDRLPLANSEQRRCISRSRRSYGYCVVRLPVTVHTAFEGTSARVFVGHRRPRASGLKVSPDKTRARSECEDGEDKETGSHPCTCPNLTCVRSRLPESTIKRR